MPMFGNILEKDERVRGRTLHSSVAPAPNLHLPNMSRVMEEGTGDGMETGPKKAPLRCVASSLSLGSFCRSVINQCKILSVEM